MRKWIPACAGMTGRMLQKIKELYSVSRPFLVAGPDPHVGEPRMFMKNKREPTWNVIENKRVVRSRCEEVDSRLRGNDR